MTPFQFGTGFARNWNRWPTTGLKSFFISHSSINWPSVRARQIFSGGYGISRSMTTERRGVWFDSWIHPFQKVFELVKPVAPESSVDAHPVDQGRQGLRLCAVVRLASLAAMPYQLCPLQHRQVLRNGRLRNAGVIGQDVHRLFPVAGQALEDRPTRRVRRGP